MQWLLAIVAGYVIYRLRGRIGQGLGAALERYNDEEERELQAWVRGVKRMEAIRRAGPEGIEPDEEELRAQTRWRKARVASLRSELEQLYERARTRTAFPISRRRRRRR